MPLESMFHFLRRVREWSLLIDELPFQATSQIEEAMAAAPGVTPPPPSFPPFGNHNAKRADQSQTPFPKHIQLFTIN